ncbi:MAG TPA: endolytic transglycosylase MltG [Candidatus Acidoferrum sp.]|nr:endolytic transglycosylase MltG [Candidatus Acidoferrum sp.]
MKFLGKLFLLLLLIATAAAGYFWYGMEKPFGTYPAEGTFVDIPHGASRRSVARLLEKEGIVRNSIAFEIYARRHPKRTLQAGEYFFDHAVSGKDVFWTVANGKVYQRPFTVREGETMFDVARELEAGKFMSAEEFLTAAKNPELIHDLAPQAKTLEGFLFPATYQLARHPVAKELVAQMTQKFREQWSQIDAAKADPTGVGHGHPLLSTVTLASLVERETPKPEERLLVAGVFENRLKKGMLLQCDPTVIYALEQDGSYNGSLTGKDLHIESPYNTYMHGGLPPGPIGNPGAISLRAALGPADTPFLYFVANTQGGHFFSATLAEHNQNVNRYRRLLAGQPADPPPAPPAQSSRKNSQEKKRKGSGQ